eukprot:12880010-Prorocentrum_lima.AAC.1
MPTPGACSHVRAQLGFSPAASTPHPDRSPGETSGWDPAMRPPSFGAGSQHDVGSLKVRKKLPVWDV